MIDFKDEFLRLCSFPRFWSAEKSFLALRGFYYSGTDLQIVCAFCEVNLNLHAVKVEEIKEKHSEERCMVGKLDGNLALGSVADYKYEKNRLCSFMMDKWPHPVDPNGLASTGFYWTGYYDMVRCVFCGIEVKDWELGDTGEDAHSSFNPDCPFLRGDDVGNIPIAFQNPDERVARHLIKENKNAEAMKLMNSEEDCQQVSDSLALALKPVFPGFAAPVIRFKSFGMWPKGIRPRPDELSEAGFFYTGKGDRVMCFQCGGGLMNWDENLSAWEEHALWFPTCSFVAIMKGTDFIEQVHAAAIASFENMEDSEDSINLEDSDSRKEEGNDKKVEAICAQEGSSMMCKLCRESEIRTVTLPCGHMTTCPKCAPKLENCLVCGKVASTFLVTYLS